MIAHFDTHETESWVDIRNISTFRELTRLFTQFSEGKTISFRKKVYMTDKTKF